jgi:hypothetical protein
MPGKKEKQNISSTGQTFNYDCTWFSKNNKPEFSLRTPPSRSSLTPSCTTGNALSSGNRPRPEMMEWSASWPPWLSIGRRIARAVSPSSGRAGRRKARGRPSLAARPRLARRVARTPTVLAPPAGSRQTTGGTFPTTGPSATLCARLHRHGPVLHGRARLASRRRLHRPICREADQPREVRTMSLILNNNY